MRKRVESILPIVLEYLEPGWTDLTLDCLSQAGFDSPLIVKRDGVGSMSRAFNSARPYVTQDIEYIWFLTNVSFLPSLPDKLLETMRNNPKAAGVHPAMRNSDHNFLRSATEVEEIPFIEWTAPFLRVDALNACGWLNESMWYVHFDLEWSYRVKNNGYKLLVDGRAEVGHQYLYRNHEHPISKIRHQLRATLLEESAKAMAKAMGFPFSSIGASELVAKTYCA